MTSQYLGCYLVVYKHPDSVKPPIFLCGGIIASLHWSLVLRLS